MLGCKMESVTDMGGPKLGNPCILWEKEGREIDTVDCRLQIDTADRDPDTKINTNIDEILYLWAP